MQGIMERRKEPREHVRDGVLYLHESESLTQSAQNGLAFDVSHDGACIYTQQEYREEDTIKVFCKQISDRPVTARVKWCKRMDENLFKIGLIFRD